MSGGLTFCNISAETLPMDSYIGGVKNEILETPITNERSQIEYHGPRLCVSRRLRAERIINRKDIFSTLYSNSGTKCSHGQRR